MNTTKIDEISKFTDEIRELKNTLSVIKEKQAAVTTIYAEDMICQDDLDNIGSDLY